MFFLVPFAVSWSNQLLTTAFEMGLRSVDASYREKMMKTLKSGGDVLTESSQAITWLYDVEKEPYNIQSFNHWHFAQTPYATITDYEAHNDLDNLYVSIDDFENNIFKGAMTKPWPFAFAFKSYITLVCDAFSVFHGTELFSTDFPKGDDNAKKFNVKYNGKDATLLSVWENGCGVFDGKDINATVDELMKTYKNDYNFRVYWDDIKTETHDITVNNGYSTLKPGATLSDEYIKKCQDITKQQVAKAGYALAVAFNRISIPVFEDPAVLPKVRASETAAWTILCFLVPILGLSWYKLLAKPVAQ